MREQSVLETRTKIRNAKSGKEIAEAIKNHFSQYKPVGQPSSSWKDIIADLDAPLLGTTQYNS